MIEDFFMFIIRIIVVIGTIIFVIASVYSFSVIVKGKEIEMTLVDISENLMSSGFVLKDDAGDVVGSLVSARAVFNEDVLKRLDKSAIEPVRHCKIGVCAIFYKFSESINYEKIAAFGYPYYKLLGKNVLPCPGPSNYVKYDGYSRTFPVGIQTKDGALLAGVMELRVYYSPLSRISCAIEDVLKYSRYEVVTAEVRSGIEADKDQYDNDVICLVDDKGNTECRYMPGLNSNNFKSEIIDKTNKVVVLPLKKDSPRSCVHYTNEELIEANKAHLATQNPEFVLLCPFEE